MLLQQAPSSIDSMMTLIILSTSFIISLDSCIKLIISSLWSTQFATPIHTSFCYGHSVLDIAFISTSSQLVQWKKSTDSLKLTEVRSIITIQKLWTATQQSELSIQWLSHKMLIIKISIKIFLDNKFPLLLGYGTQHKWKFHHQSSWLSQSLWWFKIGMPLMLLFFQLHSNGSWCLEIIWLDSSITLEILKVKWFQSKDVWCYWKFLTRTSINQDTKIQNGQEKEQLKWRTST